MEEKDKKAGEQLKRWLTILEFVAEHKHGTKIQGENGIMACLEDNGFVEKDSAGKSYPTVKTIQRDMTALEELSYIESDRDKSNKKTGMYRINREKCNGISKLLKLNFSSEMMLTLLLTKDLYKQFIGTELTESVNELYRIVSLAYGGEITPSPIIKKFGPRRHFTAEQGRILDDLIVACNEQLVVNAVYNDNECQLLPIRLIQYSDAFYLIAQYKGRSTPYILHVSRLQDVEIIDETFNVSFDVNTYLRDRLNHSFGISIEGSAVDVSLQFSKSVTNAIRERVWHDSQAIEEDDSGITLKMKVYPTSELCAWMLSWGKQLLEISPKSLKEKYVEMRG